MLPCPNPRSGILRCPAEMWGMFSIKWGRLGGGFTAATYGNGNIP